MKKVYLSGGIKDLSTEAASCWRYAVTEALEIVEILKTKDKVIQQYGVGNGEVPVQRFSCLDPMRHNFRDSEFQSQNEIVQLDKADIIACDIMIVNATKPSWGTAMEILFAFQNHKIIVCFTGTKYEEVSKWVAFHSTRVCKTLDEAIEYIKDLR